MTTKKIPTPIVAPITNSDTVYTGAPGQIVPAPIVDAFEEMKKIPAPATVVDSLTTMASALSPMTRIYQYWRHGTTEEVILDRTTYQENGALALVMLDAQDKQIVTVISINIPEVSLGEGEIVVKNYSENEGMALWLANNNIAAFTGSSVQLPHGVSCPIMKLL